MKKLTLILLILAILPSATALDLYHNITMTYDRGEVTLISSSVTPLENYDLEYYKTLKDYTALLVDEESALSIYHFDFNLLMHVFGIADGLIVNTQEIKKDQNTISAYFPYNEDATAIIIKNYELNTILTINLKETEKEVAEEAPQEKKELPISYIIIGGVLFAILLILWIILKKKK